MLLVLIKNKSHFKLLYANKRNIHILYDAMLGVDSDSQKPQNFPKHISEFPKSILGVT